MYDARTAGQKEGNVMKESWKQFRVWAIVTACCMLALGVVMVIWPEISAIAVCCIMGAVCLVVGTCEIVRYFKLGLVGVFFRYDLSLGILSILLGLLLFIHPDGAMVFLPIAIGVYMIVGSVFCIQLAVELHGFGNGSWWLALLWGIVGALFALLLLIDPFSGAAALMIFVGISLIVSGVQNLYLIFCISKEMKNGKNSRIIDVE
jgi:uncharacterized membrane protein HdeD (DUF308 family)